ncbi:MAG: mannitol dehydrogenase family protein [Pseudomonadota bacterium]
MHLGTGAFHKAHQAVYTDTLLNLSPGNWMITAASLRSPAVRDALAPQDYLYSVWAKDEPPRVIGAIKQILFACESPAALIAAMAAPETHIISLTITEKGYYRSGATGDLLHGDPDIVADLASPETPVTALGFLGAALRRRRAIDQGVSILSCDNLPGNGTATRKVVLAYCEQLQPGLGQWVADRVSFPSTMVDRIVPAMTEGTRAEIAAEVGMRDEAGVVTEPFSQWVIEDDFVCGRPEWDQAGALFTDDVSRFEQMKLRLLNGAHSAIAYLGHLGGFTYVSECMADTHFASWLVRLMDQEVLPTIEAPEGYSLREYSARLRQRFCNQHLEHRCLQIAMDGSQKLPQRQLNTARARLAKGLPVDALALAIGAWMIFVTGENLRRIPHEVQDPLASELLQLAVPHIGDADSLVKSLLGFRPVFGEDLQHQPDFVKQLTNAVDQLYKHGVAGALR